MDFCFDSITGFDSGLQLLILDFDWISRLHVSIGFLDYRFRFWISVSIRLQLIDSVTYRLHLIDSGFLFNDYSLSISGFRFQLVDSGHTIGIDFCLSIVDFGLWISAYRFVLIDFCLWICAYRFLSVDFCLWILLQFLWIIQTLKLHFTDFNTMFFCLLTSILW